MLTTEGRADSLQKGAHTSRGQWHHQVTAASLSTLQQQAYAEYKESSTLETETLQFTEWCEKMTSQYPMFFYWSKTLHLELLFLQFIASQREGDFGIYVALQEERITSRSK